VPEDSGQITHPEVGPVPENPPGQLAPPGADSGAGPGADPEADPVSEPKPARTRTGRNLPLAAAIGAGLGGLVLVTLFTVKATFLIYVGAVAAVALWELRQALAGRGISLPLVPIGAGGVAMFTLAYWYGAQPALAAMAVTVLVLMAWRLPGGAAGYLRDLTASVFTLAYLPLLGVFVPLMLSAPDGARRTLIFVVLAICSDIGGYFAGIFAGRHAMAPAISPHKTWEGFAGSVVLGLAAGAVLLSWLLHAHVWQGLLLGAAAVAAATLGDLVESMIKRDLQIKDMGSVFPGHGGAMDRLDSLVFVAPVAWLLMTVFVPPG
jgi:phosphatidate cytidylyltransferase